MQIIRTSYNSAIPEV